MLCTQPLQALDKDTLKIPQMSRWPAKTDATQPQELAEYMP